jgi:hypothetical protein
MTNKKEVIAAIIADATGGDLPTGSEYEAAKTILAHVCNWVDEIFDREDATNLERELTQAILAKPEAAYMQGLK